MISITVNDTEGDNMIMSSSRPKEPYKDTEDNEDKEESLDAQKSSPSIISELSSNRRTPQLNANRFLGERSAHTDELPKRGRIKLLTTLNSMTPSEKEPSQHSQNIFKKDKEGYDKSLLSVRPRRTSAHQPLKKSISRNTSMLAMMIRARNNLRRITFHQEMGSEAALEERQLTKIYHKNIISADHQTDYKENFGFFGNLFFFNVNRIFKISRFRMLLRRDLTPLPLHFRAKAAYETFSRIYYTEIDRSAHIPLWKAMYLYQRKNIFIAILLRIISDGIMVGLPLVIRAYSRNLRADPIGLSSCLALLVVIPAMMLAQDLLRQHSDKKIAGAKTGIGQSLRTLLYKKLVNADYNFVKVADPSLLSRLIFFEFKYILDFIGVVPGLVSSPLAIMFSGVLVIINLMNLNIFIVIIFTLAQILLFLLLLNYLNTEVTKGRDKYSAIESKIAIKVQELITNIKDVRVNCYENYFHMELLAIRKQAEKALKQIHSFKGFIEFILILTPFLFSCVIVLFYNTIYSENRIETGKTITIISMMVAVTIPLRAFSDALKKIKIFFIAYKCSSIFFNKVKESSRCRFDDIGITAGQVILKKCDFASDKGSAVRKVNEAFNSFKKKNLASKRNIKVERLTLVRSRAKGKSKVIKTPGKKSSEIAASKIVLKKLSFKVNAGDKICLIGRQGCGKEQLFLALMSQLALVNGTASKNGKIAYLDMANPKFLKATIRENIVLGEEFLVDRFMKVLEVVGFNIDKFEGRDLTEISEGQRNLTTEDQKMILLARLLYTDADIMLINLYFDMLSKDRQQPVFEQIVRRYLTNKTVIYTSDVNLIVKQSDRIFVFKDGKIVEKGSYDTLITQRKSHMYEVIMTDNSGSTNFFGKVLEGLRIYPKEVKKELLTNNEESTFRDEFSFISGNLDRIKSPIKSRRRSRFQETEKAKNIIRNWAARTTDRIRGKKFSKERDQVLKNKNETVKGIMFAAGKCMFFLLIFSFVMTDLILISIQFWMAFWSNNYFELEYNTSFRVYIAFFGVACLCVISRQMLFTHLMIHNLTKVFNRCVSKMLSAPNKWFDQNPASRIVYLLTKDQLIVDNDLIASLFVVIDSFIILLVTFLTLNVFYAGVMLVISLLLFSLAYSLYTKFLKVAQRLIAFNIKSRAELINLYLDMFDNLTMLKCMGKNNYFTTMFYKRLNAFQTATTNLYNHSMKWMHIRISFLSITSIMIILTLPLISRLYLSSVYLRSSWSLSYVANNGPFFLASLINFSKFFPMMILDLLSAQRIFHFIIRNNEDGENRFITLNKGRADQRGSNTVERFVNSFRGAFYRQKRMSANSIVEQPFRRGFNISTSRKEDKLANETVTKIKVVNRWVQALNLKNLRENNISSLNKNKYQIQSKPIVLMRNISYSTPNLKILKSINLKIYQAERIALVAEKNSGRDSLIDLLLLLIKRDESDDSNNVLANPSCSSLHHRRTNTQGLTTAQKPIKRLKRKLTLNNIESSFFEMMDENVDYCDKAELRKKMHFLPQYPLLYSGTVRQNIDPDNEWSDKKIITTLHFFKIFKALQIFSGYEKPNEIILSLKQKEGKLEVTEIDVDDYFSSTIKMTTMIHQASKGASVEDLGTIEKKFERSSHRKLSRKELREQMHSQFNREGSLIRKSLKVKASPIMSKRRPAITKTMLMRVGGMTRWQEIRHFIARSGLMEEKVDEAEMFFQEQHDDEIPRAERARRIDERLQEFDDDYLHHRVIFEDEYNLTQHFLNMQVGQNGKMLNSAIKKIIQITRAVLRNPKLLILDEDSLTVPDINSKFFIEQVFKILKDSAIVSIVRNYRQLYHYTRVYIMKEGEIVESGHPLSLVDQKDSILYKILVKDDIRTVRQLENKLEKNIRKFEEDQDANVKYIQELMAEEIRREKERAERTEKSRNDSIRDRIVEVDSGRYSAGSSSSAKEDEDNLIVFEVFSRKSSIQKCASPPDLNREYKNQFSLASKGGVELMLTPAPERSQRNKETLDGSFSGQNSQNVMSGSRDILELADDEDNEEGEEDEDDEEESSIEVIFYTKNQKRMRVKTTGTSEKATTRHHSNSRIPVLEMENSSSVEVGAVAELKSKGSHDLGPKEEIIEGGAPGRIVLRESVHSNLSRKLTR